MLNRKKIERLEHEILALKAQMDVVQTVLQGQDTLNKKILDAIDRLIEDGHTYELKND